MIEPIESFCRRHGLPWSEQTGERFAAYLELLQRFNEGMNLIGPLDAEAIVHELLIDSLVPAAICKPGATMLDVGSGAGLPGLPLKIVFPDAALTMVEPRRKRATFLKIATNRLGLEHVTIENARIEEVAPRRFDYVISKAFQPPVQWLETAHNWVSDTGVIICLTRPQEKPDLLAAAQRLGLRLVGGADDVEQLGAQVSGDARAVYAFGT